MRYTKRSGCGTRLLGVVVGVALIVIGLLVVSDGVPMAGTIMVLTGGIVSSFTLA